MGAIDRRKRVAHDRRRGYAERGYCPRFLPFQFFDHTGSKTLLYLCTLKKCFSKHSDCTPLSLSDAEVLLRFQFFLPKRPKHLQPVYSLEVHPKLPDNNLRESGQILLESPLYNQAVACLQN
jgi:hypothetical protein